MFADLCPEACAPDLAKFIPLSQNEVWEDEDTSMEHAWGQGLTTGWVEVLLPEIASQPRPLSSLPWVRGTGGKGLNPTYLPSEPQS